MVSNLQDPDLRKAWEDWVTRACDAVGVDPRLVDIDEVHRLTKHVAHRFERPMAPVSSLILGLAIASGGDPLDLRRRIEATLPGPVDPAD